eukprot:TRINITY_DN3643_c0_g1_i6.p1 TRINITY_DN3643_c0_g1~~TRINITY_DN3643_c0_g1_i6.p1  ORF type:complete len:378 (+),score=128.00 TRINITY_DN3643_c0_g1_i6:883-2016(+)
MTLTISMKGVAGPTKSTLYLIDLAASDRRIKSKKESKLFTEHTVVSEQFNTLLKVLQGQTGAGDTSTAPYNESHLTRVLKELLVKDSYIAFVGHIVQSEAAYEETMYTISYVQKCCCASAGRMSKGGTKEVSAAVRERMLRKLSQENNDLKAKLERIKRTHDKQLDELKDLLGLEIDFEHLTTRKISSKEMEFINAHKKAVEEGDELDKRNRELEEELQQTNEELKRLHKEYDDLQEDRSCQYIIMQEQISRVKAEIKEYEQKKATRMQYYENLKNKQAEIVEKNADQAIEDKAVIIGSVKSILKAKEKMAKETKDLRMTQKKVEEKLYSTMAQANEKNYKTEKEQLISKYTILLEEQKREHDKYVTLYQDFRAKKK